MVTNLTFLDTFQDGRRDDPKHLLTKIHKYKF